MAKNFQTNISAFNDLPGKELYIFPFSTSADHPSDDLFRVSLGVNVAAPTPDAKAVANPQGQSATPFTFALSQVPETSLAGGSVKIVDSTVFNVSTQIAVAQVTVEPGAMRELHVRELLAVSFNRADSMHNTVAPDPG